MQTQTKIQKVQLNSQLLAVFVTALGLNMLIEGLGRSSLVSLLGHMVYQPVFFTQGFGACHHCHALVGNGSGQFCGVVLSYHAVFCY